MRTPFPSRPIYPPGKGPPVAPRAKRDVFPHRRVLPSGSAATLDGLRDYQKEGVAWLREHRHALLAYEQRVGKTPTTLRALPRGARVIVVCPATIKLQWRDAVRLWRGDLRPRVHSAGELLAPEPGEVVITNYEALPIPVSPKALVDENLADVFAIIDEAHAVKNPEADRTLKVRALTAQVHAVYALTGTPMPNGPLDLWGLLEATGMAKKAFGSFKAFLETFGGKKSRRMGAPYVFDCHDLSAGKAALQKVMLRKTRADVAPELPPKVVTVIPVEVEASGVVEAADQSWPMDAEEMPPFEMLSAAMAELARLKVDAMLEVVEEHEAAGLPLLVFSAHMDPIRALMGRGGWETITGEEGSPEKRHAVVGAFQRGELKGLGITIRAGGTGLALHRARDVLFVSLEYTPALNEQAEDRAVSLGEKTALNVNLLVADHALDRRLFQILRAKEDLIEGVVG